MPEGSMDLELVKEGVQSKCPGLFATQKVALSGFGFLGFRV